MGDAFCASASVDCGDCRSPYLRPHSPCRNAIVLSGAGDRLGVVPVIGLALSAGAPPDYVADAKPVDRRPRNLVLGIVTLICVAVVVLQPQLTPWLLALFGLDAAGLAVALIGVAALALPLAMADSATPIRELPGDRVVLTRRNVMLCATAAVTVAVWYAAQGSAIYRSPL